MAPEARRRRVAELIGRHPLQDPRQFGDPVAELAGAGRFLLVEVAHRHDGLHWMSAHDSPDDAAAYHDSQEYAEDWLIVTLVDLDTGDTFEAETHTLFRRAG
ncbi:MAG: hypothetical protein ACLGI2_14495 [Acidimicrobiia bacterium]